MTIEIYFDKLKDDHKGNL